MFEKYRDYFDIDPDFFAQVNEAVIKKYPNIWKKYYPHATFVRLIKDTVSVLSRQQKLSVWVEGGYGTGKSHAVLTLKKLLDASEQETREYFERYELDNDLLNKLQSVKNDGKILTVHRYGSASIQGDNDLVLAIQESVEQAFNQAGIENKGVDALKTSVIKYLSDPENKKSFNIYVTGSYSDLFGGDDVDTIIEKLSSYADLPLHTLMSKIFKVAKERQIRAFTLTTTDLCNWIKETIRKNDLKAIVFIWDEFTEYFGTNIRNLTGFQEIAEISATDPFYLMIVTHKSAGLFNDADKDKMKILDRFVKPTCVIELPENIAIQLMGAAMEKNKDEQALADWRETVDELYDRTKDARKLVKSSAKITDEELKNILPIHPYAALLLKHIASAFDSNQRSMFDFIKNDRGDEVKGFQWFIDNYGPLDENPFLTVDMLWPFFEMGKKYLSHDIRVIMDCYSNSSIKQLGDEEKRVLKTVLLLQAISQKAGDSVELFIPNDKNINNAFEGSDLDGGAAARCAAKLARDKILYPKSLGGDKFQYSALTNGVDTEKTDALKEEQEKKLTSALISEGNLSEALVLPAPLKLRYSVSFAASNDFDSTIKKLRAQESSFDNKVCAVMTFAKNDDESIVIGKKIKDAILDGSYNMVFIDASVVPLGKDAFDQYCDNKAKAIYQTGKNNDEARTYNGYALQVLNNWKNRIASGGVIVFSKEKPDGERVPTMDALCDVLRTYDKKEFPDCLECAYSVTDPLYTASSLKLGVECGASQETMQLYRSANQSTKLENAFLGAWKIENYWQAKPHLLISRIKISVDKMVAEAFAKEGRVSISRIYGMLKAKPYGFMPCNLSAFVMGFILKEYIDGSYTWSDGITNDTLGILKLKEMIDEVIKLDITPNQRYKDKYIVTLTAEEKAFNEATSKIFAIPQSLCTSVEQTRERIRGKMKEYSFPIWVLKYVLPKESLKTKGSTLSELIDYYCGIANSNNLGSSKTDNDIAIAIGKLCSENINASDDMKSLLSKEKCIDGMREYLEAYDGRALPMLAEEVGDNGQYINVLRRKFDADAANWVWNIDTAKQKIDEVILDYRIIAESNKVIAKNITFENTIREWCDKCNFIRISYPAAKNYLNEVGPFLEMLYNMRRSGTLLDSQKKVFLDLLMRNQEDFKFFYNNQVELFKQVCSYYVEEFSDDEVRELFSAIPTGSFTKDKSEYTTIVAGKVDEYKSNLGYVKLKKLWRDNTESDSPRAWSKKYKMPILAMIPDKDMQSAKMAFATLNKAHPDASSINKALAYLENANFYDALKNAEERDMAFINITEDRTKISNPSLPARKPYRIVGFLTILKPCCESIHSAKSFLLRFLLR